MTATDADRTQAAELLAQPPGYRGANHITAVAAALAAARAEHGPRHCVSVDDANRVLSEERAAHERTAAALAEARAEAGEERDRALEAVMSAQAKAARLREELDRLRADAEQQARAREAQAWDRGYGAGDRDAYKAAEARQWNGRDLGDDERETNPYRPTALTAEDPAARP